jgi:predicted outer membrane repeat protein
MQTAQTAITIMGNGAVFDAGGKDNFFNVEQAVALVMSNVTLQNGSPYGGGGAIRVDGGTVTLSNCIFTRNTVFYHYHGGIGNGGAISVYGTATLSDCTFTANTAAVDGGALYFLPDSNGLLKNCSLLGTVSYNNNDIARRDGSSGYTTANVTFACADGEVGTPVQMSGSEITKLPAPTCTAKTALFRSDWIARWGTPSGLSLSSC